MTETNEIAPDLSKAAKMWGDGKTMTQIAARLGVSRNKISGFIFRNRGLFPQRGSGTRVNPVAGDKALAAAKLDKLAMAKLWAKGKTAREIADANGTKLERIYQIIERNREMFPRRRMNKNPTKIIAATQTLVGKPLAPRPIPANCMKFVTQAGYEVTLPRVSILENRA